jgi:hypothetical protein
MRELRKRAGERSRSPDVRELKPTREPERKEGIKDGKRKSGPIGRK